MACQASYHLCFLRMASQQKTVECDLRLLRLWQEETLYGAIQFSHFVFNPPGLVTLSCKGSWSNINKLIAFRKEFKDIGIGRQHQQQQHQNLNSLKS